MAGDFSRQTHDPRKRFAAVLMQQGRVQIDADWNEQAAIALDRARRQARDTFGRAAVSRFSTDQAFRIGAVAGPPRDLSIAPGRMYVEGHLAEAFAGDGTPISYLRQPFLPEPPPLPTSGGAVVFLDVWQREVTWVEDPSLLDVALGGVDTAARLQTVWQVRVAPERQPACGMDPDALLPSSPARLTTRAVAPPAPEDPCLIAPKTGYRGLENRLYRVEVHTGGPTGAARFKFSRDNASVRSPVTAMRREMRGGKEVTILSVSRIGRDPGLRIAAGDWVEITDEHRFLNGESGAMAQVAEPPLEEPGLEGFAVVLDRVIPAAGERGFASTAAGHEERRTRIIRWDQVAPRNSLDQNGLMAVAGGMIALEEGIEVDFTLSGGTQYRAGDYWIFAARTADASVEELTAAPPHGPIHHAAQLAAITDITSNEDPSDCRTLWPPLAPQGGDGCCTVVVRPGEDIQAAIDSLTEAGGCVCLKAGIHQLSRPLRIRRPRVSLHAEAPGAAVLTRATEAPLLVIGTEAGAQGLPVADVTVSGIVFQLGSVAQRTQPTGLVTVEATAERVTLSHCRFLVQDFGGRSAAVYVQGGGVTISSCLIERLALGVVAEDAAADLVVSDCGFVAEPSDAASSHASAELPAFDAGLAAVGVGACGGRLTVTGNVISGYRHGVLAGAGPLGGKGLRTTVALISGNIVLRGGPREAAAAEPAAEPATEVATPAGPIRPPGRTEAVGVATRSLDITTIRDRLSSGAARLSAGERVLTLADRPEGLAATTEPVFALTERLTHREPARELDGGNSLEPVDGGSDMAFAIVSSAQNASVLENVLAWRGGPYGGILCGAGTRLAAGNDIVVVGEAVAGAIVRDTLAAATPASGMVEPLTVPAIGIASGAFGAGAAEGVEISGNMVTGPAYAVAVAGVDAGLIQANIAINGVAGVLVVGGEGMRIDGNGLFGCRLGVFTREAPRAIISGNLIGASQSYGIMATHGGAVAAGLVKISGNVLLRCAVREERAVALFAAIGDLLDPTLAAVASAELVIEHNRVEDTGWSVDYAARAGASVAIQAAAPRVSVHANDVAWSHPARSDAGLKLLEEERRKPNRALLIVPTPGAGFEPVPNRAWAASASITDNRLRGPSVDTLVQVTEGLGQGQGQRPRFLQLLLSGNVIEHWSPLDQQGGRATVDLVVMPEALVSVSGNVVRAAARTPSVRVDGPKEIAWAGNATSGQLVGASGQTNVVG
jgi:hypothetical protein